MKELDCADSSGWISRSRWIRWKWTPISPLLTVARLRSNNTRYPVHHRLPLKFAQLDPESDVNALSRLVAVAPDVHYSIGRVWTAFRPSHGSVTLAEVREVIAVVDRNYGRWYNIVYDEATQQAQLATAESVARSELAALLTRMEGR